MVDQFNTAFNGLFDSGRALRDNEQLVLEEGQEQGSLSSPKNQMKEPEDGFGQACLVANSFSKNSESIAFDDLPCPKRTFKSDIPLNVLQAANGVD